MANELDEVTGPISEEGRDVNVIQKQIQVKVGVGSTIFEILLWLLGIIPGIIFLAMKIKAKNYLDALQQKIQANASTIDNYMENRVVILTNAAKLLDKAIDLDKDVLTKVAAYRGGVNPNNDQIRSEVAGQIDGLARSINVAFEAYPDIKAHKEIAECLQQNAYLQREITSARDLYNASVTQWNQIIFRWPTYKIVAAKAGYTTRIPFTASKAIKDASRSVLF